MTPAGRDQLQEDEGLRLKPYDDGAGNITIGYGRNLSGAGITGAEANYLLTNDICRWQNALEPRSWFPALLPVRQDVCVNMMHNLGEAGFFGFVNMVIALKVGAYDHAAYQIEHSRAAIEAPGRYRRLAQAMRSATWTGLELP